MAKVRRFNERLQNLPAYDDFMSFQQPLLSLEKATVGQAHRQVKIFINWRCAEYAHLVPQLPYLVPEHEHITRLFMAWADLYNTLRATSPTVYSVQKMQAQWGLHFVDIYTIKCEWSMVKGAALMILIPWIGWSTHFRVCCKVQPLDEICTLGFLEFLWICRF